MLKKVSHELNYYFGALNEKLADVLKKIFLIVQSNNTEVKNKKYNEEKWMQNNIIYAVIKKRAHQYKCQ